VDQEDVAAAVGIDDSHARQSGRPIIIHPDFARLADQVIVSFERDIDHIVLGMVGNAQQRHPFFFDLVANPEGRPLDLGALADQALRQAVEEGAPFVLLEFLQRHGESPIRQKGKK
jgi:hypothetical protein